MYEHEGRDIFLVGCFHGCMLDEEPGCCRGIDPIWSGARDLKWGPASTVEEPKDGEGSLVAVFFLVVEWEVVVCNSRNSRGRMLSIGKEIFVFLLKEGFSGKIELRIVVSVGTGPGHVVLHEGFNNNV